MGLGNPGPQYARTRHNIGFMIVDELARRWNLDDWKSKNNARQVPARERRALLVKPQAFMNLSGPPTLVTAKFHKVQPENMLVVVDDLDLGFGRIRMRTSGSSGGHNGLKSLIALFGEAFPRVRAGIGRSRNGEAISHVLGTFAEDEADMLRDVIAASADGIELWLEKGPVAAMQFLNAWLPPGVEPPPKPQRPRKEPPPAAAEGLPAAHDPA